MWLKTAWGESLTCRRRGHARGDIWFTLWAVILESSELPNIPGIHFWFYEPKFPHKKRSHLLSRNVPTYFRGVDGDGLSSPAMTLSDGCVGDRRFTLGSAQHQGSTRVTRSSSETSRTVEARVGRGRQVLYKFGNRVGIIHRLVYTYPIRTWFSMFHI